MKTGNIYIGTSNLALPVTKDKYPEEYQGKSRLYYYSRLFNSIEINSSFYKIPRAATLKKWANETPDNFRFTLKIYKEISHSKELKTGLEFIAEFVDTANHIAHKKGCLLLQFPGKISLDYYNEVETILRELDATNTGWNVAVEFRHKSWHTGETYELLNEYHASAVLQDQAKSKNLEIIQDTAFYYFRFHGPRGDYRGSYDQGFLAEQASVYKQIAANGKEVYVYFNNTMGNAFENAMTIYNSL